MSIPAQTLKTPTIAEWETGKLQNIGNYGEPFTDQKNNLEANLKKQKEDDARVFQILGAEGYEKLHGKAYNANFEFQNESTTARTNFIQAISTSFGDKLLASNTITKDPVSLNNIANDAAAEPNGAKNLQELYEAAILEERESIAYKNAAFLQSVEVYRGGNFSKKEGEGHVIIIAGPSGAGKTRARPAVVKETTHGVLVKNSDPTQIRPDQHLVVTVDGGIEREVSQVRDLMNRASLKLGYGGIEDLEEITTKASGKTKLKNVIEEAANAKGLHLVIATTSPQKELKKYMGPGSKRNVVYSFVKIPWKTVANIAYRRAFASKKTEYKGNIDQISKPPESKKHGGLSSYLWGKREASQAGKEYLKKQKQNEERQKAGDLNTDKSSSEIKETVEKAEIYKIKKDLVFMKFVDEKGNTTNLDSKKKAVDFKSSNKGISMTVRQVKAWEAYKKENPDADARDWYKNNKENEMLVSEKIIIGTSKKTIQEIEQSQRTDIENSIKELKDNASKGFDGEGDSLLKLRLLKDNSVLQFKDLLSLFENPESLKNLSWPYSHASNALIAELFKKQQALIESPNISLDEKNKALQEMNTLKDKLLIFNLKDNTKKIQELQSKLEKITDNRISIENIENEIVILKREQSNPKFKAIIDKIDALELNFKSINPSTPITSKAEVHQEENVDPDDEIELPPPPAPPVSQAYPAELTVKEPLIEQKVKVEEKPLAINSEKSDFLELPSKVEEYNLEKIKEVLKDVNFTNLLNILHRDCKFYITSDQGEKQRFFFKNDNLAVQNIREPGIDTLTMQEFIPKLYEFLSGEKLSPEELAKIPELKNNNDIILFFENIKDPSALLALSEICDIAPFTSSGEESIKTAFFFTENNTTTNFTGGSIRERAYSFSVTKSARGFSAEYSGNVLGITKKELSPTVLQRDEDNHLKTDEGYTGDSNSFLFSVKASATVSTNPNTGIVKLQQNSSFENIPSDKKFQIILDAKEREILLRKINKKPSWFSSLLNRIKDYFSKSSRVDASTIQPMSPTNVSNAPQEPANPVMVPLTRSNSIEPPLSLIANPESSREPPPSTYPPKLGKAHPISEKMRPLSEVLLTQKQVQEIDTMKDMAKIKTTDSADGNLKKLEYLEGKDPVAVVNRFEALQKTADEKPIEYVLEISGSIQDNRTKDFAINQLMSCGENTKIIGITTKDGYSNVPLDVTEFNKWVVESQTLTNIYSLNNI